MSARVRGTSRRATPGVRRARAAPTSRAASSVATQPVYVTSWLTFANPVAVGRPCDFATAVVGTQAWKVAYRQAR